MNTLPQTDFPAGRRKVFVVDDHPIVRQGLGSLIARQQELVICGEAEAANAAVRGIANRKPDILILDISLSGPDGLDLLKSVRIRDPFLPVLVLSMHDEAIYVERALRAGANGYIMKEEATEAVLVAMRRILNGEIYVSERIARKMLREYIKGLPSVRQSLVADLNDRELEVFRLIGEGHSARNIAEELYLSIKTVDSYQAHIKEKKRSSLFAPDASWCNARFNGRSTNEQLGVCCLASAGDRPPHQDRVGLNASEG